MKSSITFLGHVINSKGISADLQKLSAIKQKTPPTNITELQRFNWLGKFSPNFAEIQPHYGNCWAQRMLGCGDLNKRHLLQQLSNFIASQDASSYGLGAVLLQSSDSRWHPVAYVSRAMTDTESHYAQIKKEALALIWACKNSAATF